MRVHVLRRALALTLAAAVALGTAVVTAPLAAADSAPVNPSDPKTPVTVTADALPTAQINGVAWQQVIVGNTVYVAGKFTTARPAGAAAGSQTVTRNNILAYNLSTGALISSFAPNLNAQALSIAAAPDGSRIYVGGDFTKVNGTTVWRVAALDPSSGALITSFLPKMASSVRAIVATAGTVYLGGQFTAVGSTSRGQLAAVRASDGGLLGWNPKAAGGKVNALALSPDGASMAVGGAFTTLNGSSKPGYGLGRVNTTTGASLSFVMNNTVRDAGQDSAITSLFSDGTNVYGTGYIYGTGGNLEGSFSANWSDGGIKWIEDCHGDSYSIWASSTAAYLAGHPHYCGNIGGFPQTDPRTWHRAMGFSKAATGTMTKDIYGYPSFTGIASPAELDWFPDLDTGTATGQSQGPWTVTGTEKYVAMAGEFLHVNGTAQQGLVRFAVKEIAPNKQGPRVTGASFKPTLTYTSAGTVKVQWQANWDRDNENLTYQVVRDGTVVNTVSQLSRFYKRPTLTYTDTGLSKGTHSYRIYVKDPLGNEVRGDSVSVSVTTGAAVADPPAADPPADQTSASDAFGRTLASGWGSADTGGAWSLNGSASYFSVGGGVGSILLNKAGAGPSAYLAAVSSTSAESQVKVALDKVANGGGTYIYLTGRRVGTSGEYRAKAKISASGSVALDVTKVIGGTMTTLGSQSASLSYAVGDQLQIKFRVTGTAPTTLQAKVWKVGSAEPSGWLISTTDSTSALQAAGGVGLMAYVSGSTTNAPVTAKFDDFATNPV